jgi:hypothetical protein
MSTYLDLINRIASDLTRTDLTSQSKNAVQDAIKHYETSRFWFNVTRSLTFSTVIGQQAYGSAALSQIPNVIRFDHLFITVGTAIYELDFCEADQFEWLSSNSVINGQPTDYTFIDGQVLLWPVPAAVYTLRPHMHYRLSTLSADTDTNAWCNEAEMLIRTHAKLLLYMDVLEDNDGAGRMQAKIQALKDKLDYETSARFATGRIRSTASNAGYSVSENTSRTCRDYEAGPGATC